MKVKFYGTRGSIPICGPEFQEFGGNTTCVLVEGPKGTGIFATQMQSDYFPVPLDNIRVRNLSA
jgi:hypothetical protein